MGLQADACADAPVFPSKSGKPLDRSRVLRIVKGVAVRAGVNLNLTSHWLRHAQGHGRFTADYTSKRPTTRVCWAGEWDKRRVVFHVMVERKIQTAETVTTLFL